MIEDTLKVAIDTIKTIADTTPVKAVTETTIWQDKSLMQVFAIVGGIILILFGLYIWDVIVEKKSKK